jgi:cytidine deaminase
VIVNRGGEVVAPCGICRELMSDYAPDAEVIAPGAEGPERASIRTLLPNKYARARN